MKKRNGIKIIASLAMLAALSIILGKYLAIPVGEIMRFSLESMPIIFAGMVFGPLAGGLCGLVADLIGCLLRGYEINIAVSLGAMVIGVISGALPILLRALGAKRLPLTVITVLAAHIIGSMLIKTLGLAAYYEMPFYAVLLWRVVNYVIVGALDCVTVHILLGNKGIKMEIKKLGGAAYDL